MKLLPAVAVPCREGVDPAAGVRVPSSAGVEPTGCPRQGWSLVGSSTLGWGEHHAVGVDPVRLAGGNRTPVELARCPGRTTPGECAPTMSDDDSVARKTLDRSAATTLRDDRGDPSSVRSSTARPALWLRPNPGSAMIPSWVKAPRLRNGAPARRTGTLRAEQRHAPHHTEGATPAPRKRNDTEKNPNRQRSTHVPETTRPHNEPDRHRAPQVQQKRKETPPPQARTDNAPNPERPEPTRRRASGGASSFTRFFGPGFPVRLAPDLRR